MVAPAVVRRRAGAADDAPQEPGQVLERAKASAVPTPRPPPTTTGAVASVIASGHYGPKVEVPADADEQTRLIAFTGRQP